MIRFTARFVMQAYCPAQLRSMIDRRVFTEMVMVMNSLDAMLKRAASADEWTRVVHRCAWCHRVVNEHGEYAIAVALDAETVVTDGMCPPCGRRALAELAARHTRLAA